MRMKHRQPVPTTPQHSGVIGVSNRIKIMPRMALKPTPNEVRDKIETAPRRSAEIDARGLIVQVEDGKVVLRGQVDSWAARQEAERVAWAAPGVSAVENDITIGV